MAGHGARLYGLRGKHGPGGLCFATRWFTLVNWPILPLARYRILILAGAEGLADDTVDHYRILETTPLAWDEAAATWWRWNGGVVLAVVPLLVLGWGVQAQRARVTHGLPRSAALTALNFVAMILFLYDLMVLSVRRLRRWG